MAQEADESANSMNESDLSFALRRDLLASAWLPKVQFLKMLLIKMLLMRMIKLQLAADQMMSQSRKQSYLSLSEMQLCCWPCLDSVSCPRSPSLSLTTLRVLSSMMFYCLVITQSLQSILPLSMHYFVMSMYYFACCLNAKRSQSPKQASFPFLMQISHPGTNTCRPPTSSDCFLFCATFAC